jgi:hypothetical protein
MANEWLLSDSRCERLDGKIRRLSAVISQLEKALQRISGNERDRTDFDDFDDFELACRDQLIEL